MDQEPPSEGKARREAWRASDRTVRRPGGCHSRFIAQVFTGHHSLSAAVSEADTVQTLWSSRSSKPFCRAGPARHRGQVPVGGGPAGGKAWPLGKMPSREPPTPKLTIVTVSPTLPDTASARVPLHLPLLAWGLPWVGPAPPPCSALPHPGAHLAQEDPP